MSCACGHGWGMHAKVRGNGIIVDGPCMRWGCACPYYTPSEPDPADTERREALYEAVRER